MSYYAVKILAEKFARQLSQPEEPSLCPFCFSDFATALVNHLSHHLPRLRAECHVLFDACIRVLLLPRASDDLETLGSTLSVRHRRCSRDGCSAVGSEKGSSALRVFLDALGQVVHAGLHLEDQSSIERASKTHDVLGDRQDRWPSQMCHLFPYGEQATFDALLDLANLFVSASPFKLLNDMLIVCRPALMPVLLVERNRTRMVNCLLRSLDARERPVLESKAPWLFGAGHSSISAAVAFINTVQRGPNAVPSDAVQLFAGRERAFLRVVTEVIETLDDADNAMCLLVPFAHDLCARIPPPYPTVSARVLELMRAHRERHKPSFAPVLYAMLTQVAHRYHCAAATCARSELQADDSGRLLQVCARCKVPRYCSRACQADDWRGGSDAVPHRMVCGIFCKIAAGTQSCADLSQKRFEELYTSAESSFDSDDYFALNAFASTVGRAFGHEFSAEELDTFPPVTVQFHLPKGARPILPYPQNIVEGSVNLMHFDISALLGRYKAHRP